MQAQSVFKMACKYYKQGVNLEEDSFGLFVDKTTGKSIPIRRFTWTNENQMSVQVINYGATVTSIKVPDKNGTVDDIIFGFDDIEGYRGSMNQYFGATVGRVANRIGNSQIVIGGHDYALHSNLGKHQLHGGVIGFDKVMWDHYVDGTKLILSYFSKDGEEGFPGNLVTNITFELDNEGSFSIDYKATTTKPTYVNLTNHAYFNLAGHNKGAKEIYKHTISINADYTTDVDTDFISTGKLLPVVETIFDLRIPKILQDVIHKLPNVGGYDHNFCINKGDNQQNTFHARVTHPPTGRAMEVYSTQPGVQFYTSNHVPENPEKYVGDKSKLIKVIGKEGANYYKHDSFCLETQNYPDAINHNNFPNAVLNPGDTYHQSTIYKFSVKKAY